jgi:hypothetical protein
MYLFRSFLFLLVTSSLVSGCILNQIGRPSYTSSEYNPSGREEFKLVAIPSPFGQFGYTHFCSTIRFKECYLEDNISAREGYGLKGYFMTEEPIKKSAAGVAIFPVMLSNGRKMYFIANPSTGGAYGYGTYIEPVDQSSFVEYPIYEGSSIKVVGEKFGTVEERRVLSTGEVVTADRLLAVMDAAKVFDSYEVADLLVTHSDIRITTDPVERITIVVPPAYYAFDSSYSVYLAFTSDKYIFGVDASYIGSTPIFANELTVRADDYFHRYGPVEYKRKDLQGDSPLVLERMDMVMDSELLEMSINLANSQVSIVRFEGDSGMRDIILDSEMRNQLAVMLELRRLIMNRGR